MDSGASGKKRMSLFTFGLSKGGKPEELLTLPNETPANARLMLSGSLQGSVTLKNTQLSSPVCLPVLELDVLSEKPELNIFERSVQDLSLPVKQEDCIPPALDATASILGSKDTNLDEVEMVYLSRRNSSVIGLNMALGRPCGPSRKNSVYLLQNQQPSSALVLSVPFPPQLPVSPPKLNSSKSLVSFYSYSDMINNDEFSRRPLLMQSFSHGPNPLVSRKMSAALNYLLNLPQLSNPFLGKPARKPTLGLILGPLQLSKQLLLPREQSRSNGPSRQPSQKDRNKFMISPESSELEDNEVFYPATSNPRRTSVTSADEELLVSALMGDCIRECSSQIGSSDDRGSSTRI